MISTDSKITQILREENPTPASQNPTDEIIKDVVDFACRTYGAADGAFSRGMRGLIEGIAAGIDGDPKDVCEKAKSNTKGVNIGFGAIVGRALLGSFGMAAGIVTAVASKPTTFIAPVTRGLKKAVEGAKKGWENAQYPSEERNEDFKVIRKEIAYMISPEETPNCEQGSLKAKHNRIVEKDIKYFGK